MNESMDNISLISEDTTGVRSRSLSAARRPMSAKKIRSPRSGGGSFLGKLRNRLAHAPDAVSVSDSLCSGVLRGDFAGSSIVSQGGSAGSTSFSVGASGRSVGSTIGNSTKIPPRATPPLPGGVADFNSNIDGKVSNDQSLTSIL